MSRLPTRISRPSAEMRKLLAQVSSLPTTSRSPR